MSRINKKYEYKYYNQKEAWKKYYTPKEQIRARDVIRLIPDDVRKILDLGCGNGIIINLLEKPFVVGCDFVKEPLRQMNGNKIQASIGDIPIKNNKFDLVISTEVLEHLDDETYDKAIKEIKRLNAKYLLISTPLNEDINEGMCKCVVCGNTFHIYHHNRNFKENWFNEEFLGYKLMKKMYGESYVPPNTWITKLKHFFGIYVYSDTAVCNKCGNRSAQSSMLFRYIFGTIAIIDNYIKRVHGVKRSYHMTILLKQKDDVSFQIGKNII